jgi:hypothetical protein
MIRKPRSATLFYLGFALLTAQTGLGEEASELVARLAPLRPCAALAQSAQTNRIPLDGIDPPGKAGVLDPGDSVTALVTVCEKTGERTQWVIYLEGAAPRPDQPPATNSRPLVLYSSLGHKWEYPSSPAPVSLRILGPFADSTTKRKTAQPVVKSVRFSLDKGLLSLGLDRACAAMLRLNAAVPRLKETGKKGALWFRDRPVSETEARENRELANSFQLTADEERSLGGAFPALLSYFRIIQETPGLQALLVKIVEMPSVWSIARNLGIHPSFAFQPERLQRADAGAFELTLSTPVYHLPLLLRLNGQPALNLTFVVTDPHPPLLACGGILGLLAERPGQNETYLTLRIISARRAANKPRSE